MPGAASENGSCGPPPIRAMTGSAGGRRLVADRDRRRATSRPPPRRGRRRARARGRAARPGRTSAPMPASRVKPDGGIDRIGGARAAAAKLDDREADRARVDRRDHAGHGSGSGLDEYRRLRGRACARWREVWRARRARRPCARSARPRRRSSSAPLDRRARPAAAVAREAAERQQLGAERETSPRAAARRAVRR